MREHAAGRVYSERSGWRGSSITPRPRTTHQLIFNLIIYAIRFGAKMSEETKLPICRTSESDMADMDLKDLGQPNSSDSEGEQEELGDTSVEEPSEEEDSDGSLQDFIVSSQASDDTKRPPDLQDLLAMLVRITCESVVQCKQGHFANFLSQTLLRLGVAVSHGGRGLLVQPGDSQSLLHQLMSFQLLRPSLPPLDPWVSTTRSPVISMSRLQTLMHLTEITMNNSRSIEFGLLPIPSSTHRLLQFIQLAAVLKVIASEMLSK